LRWVARSAARSYGSAPITALASISIRRWMLPAVHVAGSGRRLWLRPHLVVGAADATGSHDSLRLPTLESTWRTLSRASGQAEERVARRPRFGPSGRVAGIASASLGIDGALG